MLTEDQRRVVERPTALITAGLRERGRAGAGRGAFVTKNNGIFLIRTEVAELTVSGDFSAPVSAFCRRAQQTMRWIPHFGLAMLASVLPHDR